MPYIEKKQREKFQSVLETLTAIKIENAGELNYLITNVVLHYIINTDKKYQDYNDALGALEGAKLELYRRGIAPYEDKKIKENGDV